MENTEMAVKDTLWILWVDDEIWGYAGTVDEAKHFLTMISAEIGKELQHNHPNYSIESVPADEKVVKIKCLHPGYVYNSSWTAHTVRYEPVNKLQKDTAIPLTLKRAPSIDNVKAIDKSSKPATRPPTPLQMRKNPSDRLYT